MEPSAQFLKNIASNQKALRLIERSKKEFEVSETEFDKSLFLISDFQLFV